MFGVRYVPNTCDLWRTCATVAGMELEVLLTGQVEHVSGPTIEDPDHIIRWTVADGQDHNCNRHNAIGFEVCPRHSDPDECDCPPDDVYSLYRIVLVSAERSA